MLLLGAGTLWGTRIGSVEPHLRSRWSHLIVPVAPATAIDAGPTVEVQSFDDLGRLAEREGAAILYDGSTRPHSRYVVHSQQMVFHWSPQRAKGAPAR